MKRENVKQGNLILQQITALEQKIEIAQMEEKPVTVCIHFELGSYLTKETKDVIRTLCLKDLERQLKNKEKELEAL